MTFFSQIAKILSKYGYVYLEGFWGTIWISAVTVFFAVIFGIFVAILKMSRFKIAHVLVNIYVEIVRGTPILLQIYFFWLFLPKVMPIEMSDTTCVVVALIFNATSFVAEVIRAGIEAVDKGQTEAAYSLGLSQRNTMTRIILPQAIKNILPALGNEFISMIKMASMASIFFVPELTTSYRTVQSVTYMPIPSLTIAGAIYLGVTFSLTRLLGVFERKLKANER